MKINKYLVLAVLLVSLLAIIVASQSPPPTTISAEEAKVCSTIFYDDVQPIYGNCIHYFNYTHCLNSSGANTDCSTQQTQYTFTCITSEIKSTKNHTDCKPLNKFIVTINKGSSVSKKEIDFSDWGTCISKQENSCVIITCQSKYDGANDGRFHGCKDGSSCQRFEICSDGIKTLYKNSGADFVAEDPTFHLGKLPLKEVPQ